MFFEHLGTYITMFMRLAYTHQVKLDHNFVCCAMAIKVMEGLAIALDPKLGALDANFQYRSNAHASSTQH